MNKKMTLRALAGKWPRRAANGSEAERTASSASNSDRMAGIRREPATAERKKLRREGE